MTLLVAGGAWCLWLCAWMWHSMLLASFALYWMFTPLHEAAHGNVHPSCRLVNDVVGHTCGLPLLAPLPAFRRIHLRHHAHTNLVGLDPDLWASEGPWWQLPFRWSSIFLRYWWITLLQGAASDWYAMNAILVVLCGLWLMGAPVFQCWLFPHVAATATLSFTLDYLPHHGLQHGRSVDTRIVSTNPIVCGLTLMQSMHAVHHMLPRAPWHQYPGLLVLHRTQQIQVLTRRHAELLQHAARQSRRFGLFDTIKREAGG